MIRKLDDRVSVASQIMPDEVLDIAARGFVRIINNRPDGEEFGQPTGDEVRNAAMAAGLDYKAIPVAGGFSMDQVETMAAALEGEGPVLTFCRSGTRSANLWALARASRGDDPGDLISKAAVAGYDLSGLAPTLTRLSTAAN